ncbi:MAG: hypothetical protein ACLGH3_02180 [Actinomycetota bacterium]
MKERKGSVWSLLRRDAATISGAIGGLSAIVIALAAAVGIGEWLASPSLPDDNFRAPVPAMGSFESPPVSSTPLGEAPADAATDEPVAASSDARGQEPADRPSDPQANGGDNDHRGSPTKGTTEEEEPVEPVDPPAPPEAEFDAARFIEDATRSLGDATPEPVGGLVTGLGKTTSGVLRGAGNLVGGLLTVRI